MRVLLDTHVLAWALIDPAAMPPDLAAMVAGSTELLVSAASGWEMAIKYELGKWPEAGKLLALWSEALAAAGIHEVPITAAHGRLAAAMKSPHRDPFDRMIVAQSVLLGASLATVDRAVLDGFPEVLSATRRQPERP